MRNAGNFHPEWGYLAPAPSFLRTARTVIVATAIGATAGAGVVFSLVDRPAADDSLPAASVAARTLARPDAAPTAVKHAATGNGAAVSSAAASALAQPATPPVKARSLQAQSAQTQLPQNADTAPAAKLAASEANVVSTTQSPAAIAALAETPAAKPETESARPEIQTTPSAEAPPAASPPAADPPPAPKKAAKKHRAAPHYAARGDQPPVVSNNAFARPLPFQRLFNYSGDEPAGGYFRFSGR
jgi:hypothetical protein